MQRYWWKIALGVAMVFALGLTVVSMARAGKAGLQRVAATVGGRLPLELTDLPVRLDGRTIGDISGIRVRRDSRRDVGEVTLRVDLRDRAVDAELSSCEVAVESLKRFRRGARLRCAGTGEIASGELARVGEVVFEPAGLRRPLYLTAHDMDRWLDSDVRSLDADLVREGEGKVRATGRFALMPHHGRPESGTFDLVAGDGGARFVVRDERGREVVNFSAGDQGLRIKVR